MIHNKWFRCFAFIISFISFHAHSAQAPNNNSMPFDVYVKCIRALNEYFESYKYFPSGTNSSLLILYDNLPKLNFPLHIITNDDFLYKFSTVEYKNLSQLNKLFSKDFFLSLRKSINREFVKQYSSQLCSSLLSYFTLDNIHNTSVRYDAIIMLNLLQEQLDVSAEIKEKVTVAIKYIESRDFLEDMNEEDISNARRLVVFFCSSLNSQFNAMDPKEKEAAQTAILKNKNSYSILQQAFNKALENIFAAKRKLLGLSSLLLAPEEKIVSSQKVAQFQNQIPQQQPLENPTFFEKVTNFFTTIKNNIYSFIQSLFNHS